MARALSPEKREKLRQIFEDLAGSIKFEGTACDLVREVRKADFNKAL